VFLNILSQVENPFFHNRAHPLKKRPGRLRSFLWKGSTIPGRKVKPMNELDQWTDQQLVPVFGDRGYEAHTLELVRRRCADVQAVIRRRIRDAGGADEAEQDTWMRVYGGKHGFLPGGEDSAGKRSISATRARSAGWTSGNDICRWSTRS
jgi:hypothetical protein